MQKMPWLKTRLREIGRTPASLARHLGIGGPRVYEMIGGRRGLQPNEVEATAEFLNWPVEELLKHLPEEARVVLGATAEGLTKPSESPLPASRLALHSDLQMIPVLGTTRNGDCVRCDCKLTGTTTRYVETLPAFRGRSDIQSLYMGSTAMKPWRGPGELILFEQERPPAEFDYVVIYLQSDSVRTPPVMVRQLLQSKRPGKIRLRQHNPNRDSEIDLAKVASIYRVMTWDDCVR
jgi:hypothetical protein